MLFVFKETWYRLNKRLRSFKNIGCTKLIIMYSRPNNKALLKDDIRNRVKSIELLLTKIQKIFKCDAIAKGGGPGNPVFGGESLMKPIRAHLVYLEF
jgi:hypothetical protein